MKRKRSPIERMKNKVIHQKIEKQAHLQKIEKQAHLLKD